MTDEQRRQGFQGPAWRPKVCLFGALVALVYVKELRETLRDRRTLVVMVLLPIVLYPLVIFAVGQGLAVQQASWQSQPTRVRLEGPRWPELERALGQAREQKLELVSGEGPPGGEAAHRDRIRGQQTDLVLQVPADYRARFLGQGTVALKLIYDETQDRSSMGRRRLEQALKAFADQVRQERLARSGLPPSLALPLKLEPRSVASSSDVGAHLLGRVIPLLAVLMVLLGAFYPAIDLTAGEKERGTLETLLATPVPRTPVIAGKFLVVATVSAFTGLLNLGSLGLTFAVGLRSGLQATDVVLEVPWTAVALTGLAVLPAALFFSAVMVAVAALARSFKEAQNLLTPVYLVCMMPAVLATFPWVELTPATALLPAANVGLLARELIAGELPWLPVTITLVSSGLYALVALKVAARIYNSERMLFAPERELGLRGLARLLWSGRRDAAPPPEGSQQQPAAPGPLDPLPRRDQAPEPAQAGILLLVVMGGILLLGRPLQARHLMGGILFTEWVLIGIPVLLSLRLAGLDARAVLSLRRPALVALLGALLAGISGWLLVLVLVETLQQRLMPMPPEYLEQMSRALFQQEPSLALNLLALALSPAICEEILFRGVLLRASRPALGPWAAVLLNGVLFGLFHISIYRFFPTLILGLVLSLLVLRSGSILPAMLFHLLNNACALLAGRLLGAEQQAQSLLDPTLLAAALVTFAAGLYLALKRGRGRGTRSTAEPRAPRDPG